MDQGNDRQMFQGNWTCADCGTSITELPFEPKGTDNLTCRDCHSKKRASRPQRQIHQGDWNCSQCNTEIKELLFEPRDTSNLMCRDCFRKSKEPA